MDRHRQTPWFAPAEAMRAFDMLYEGAWHFMGGEHLLGATRQSMCSAYETCLVEGTAPLFWLEMPLLGTPHSDMHVSYDFREVGADAQFALGDGFGYGGLFAWFAEHGVPGSGIDYTIDLREDGIGAVGAYVSFHDAAAVDYEGFCASVGRACDAGRCRKLAAAFPPGWNVWYASPFPGRAGNPVRAAGLASKELMQAFAQDRELVREHFSRMGLSPLPDELCARVSALASLPISLELRVGMDEDDLMCSRFDVSFYLSQGHLYPADKARFFAKDGAGTRALTWFEEWGIADERWHALAEGGFSLVAPFERSDGSRCKLALLCSPTCFMMPWQGGQPLAAKSYPKLQARLMV
ncbi:MAG: hypothetical protein Q4C09_10650 [Atopobiaceae bacterium]|nr:hypothetical protein [Atopobiaceae bacterium]